MRYFAVLFFHMSCEPISGNSYILISSPKTGFIHNYAHSTFNANYLHFNLL
jgi:hypothetical protein